MGLFGKKEDCPICGGEVKGLFLVKISDKRTLCKDCSKRVSMNEKLLKTATPEFIQEHLAYRQKNAEKYTQLHWDVKYNDVTGLKVGVDPEAGCFYIIHDNLHDEDNPVIFSFDQLKGYELYRMTKRVDDADTPGETNLESGLSVMSGIATLAGNGSGSSDYFKLKLAATDPYWPEIELKISFTFSQIHGFGGFAKQMKTICQMFKQAVRKEQITFS